MKEIFPTQAAETVWGLVVFGRLVLEVHFFLMDTWELQPADPFVFPLPVFCGCCCCDVLPSSIVVFLHSSASMQTSFLVRNAYFPTPLSCQISIFSSGLVIVCFCSKSRLHHMSCQYVAFFALTIQNPQLHFEVDDLKQAHSSVGCGAVLGLTLGIGLVRLDARCLHVQEPLNLSSAGY